MVLYASDDLFSPRLFLSFISSGQFVLLRVPLPPPCFPAFLFLLRLAFRDRHQRARSFDLRSNGVFVVLDDLQGKLVSILEDKVKCRFEKYLQSKDLHLSLLFKFESRNEQEKTQEIFQEKQN